MENESNLTEQNLASNIEICTRPCSSSSIREYGPYREVDAESVISKQTATTADNQDYSDGENGEPCKLDETRVDSDFDDYEETVNSEPDDNQDESSSDSLTSENSHPQPPPPNLVTETEPISQSPFSRLTRTVRSYLNASISYQIQNSSHEIPLSNFDPCITLTSDDKKSDLINKPKFEPKSSLFDKILKETCETFPEENIQKYIYDFKLIYKLRDLFSKHENYYATMLIPISDNFLIRKKNFGAKVYNKRMKHSISEDNRYDDDNEEYMMSQDDDYDIFSNIIFNIDSNSSQESRSNNRYQNQDEFHLCSLCSHCLYEPITLVCGCSFCKNCLNEYNLTLENLSMNKNEVDDFSGSSHKRKHNNFLSTSNKIELYKCFNCSFVHEFNTSQATKQNVILSQLVNKLWLNNVEIRKLRNDLRRYVCFVIDTDLDSFCLKKFESMFLKAYDLDPSNHLIFADLFLLNYFDNCNSNCLKYAQSACELRPNWPFAFFMKSIYYLTQGDLNALKTNLKICLTLEPNLEQIKSKIQELFATRDDLSKKNSRNESNDSYLDNSQTSSSTYDLHSFSTDSSQSKDIQKKFRPEGDSNNKQSVLNFDTSKYVVVNSHLVKPTELECSLCYRLLYKPVTTPCGHSFCCSCLDRSLDHQDKCPLCKHTLADYLAERRQYVTLFLEKLIINFYSNEYEDRKKQYYDDIRELIGDENEIPIFVCTLSMPNIPCPLHIFEPRYKLMLRRAIETGSKQFGMCMYSEKTPYHYTEYGCMLEIKNCQFIRDGRAVVSTIGGRRFKVLSSSTKDGYIVAKVEWVKDVAIEGLTEKNELQQLHDDVYRLAQTWFSLIPETQKNRILDIFNISELPRPEKDIQTDNGPTWHWILLNILPIDSNFQYKFITKTSLKERLLPLKKILWMFLAPAKNLLSTHVNSVQNQENSATSTSISNDQTAGSDNMSNSETDNSETNNQDSNVTSDYSQTNNDRTTQGSL
ncbi:unnamed protein product [Brachionus calyciflorus]|uniref:Uncharacterized protein n=1 Tax=Brachionus calyciflorus TaxID=104777 RepID=A0A813WID3_9BILA|nr:unnamed protein product [Brachionus calyciflorus]